MCKPPTHATQTNRAARKVQQLRKQKSETILAGASRDEVKAIEAKSPRG